MTLREALDAAEEACYSGGSAIIFRHEDREFKISNSKYGHLLVDGRYYPDKHGGWSDWRTENGFSIEDVKSDDWDIMITVDINA